MVVREKWGKAMLLLTKILRQSDPYLLNMAERLIKSTLEKFFQEEERCQEALEGLIFHSFTWGVGRERGDDYSLKKAVL